MKLSLEVQAIKQSTASARAQTARGSTSFAEEWSSIEPREITLDTFYREFHFPKLLDSTESQAFVEVKKRGALKGKLVALDDNPAEEAFQSYVMSELSKANREVVDTSTKRYLDGRKPDVSLFEGGIQSSLYAVLVGEVKRKGDFAPSAKGELLTFLKRVLFSQPLRNRVVGFLTDGFSVILMGLKREGTIYATPQLPLDGVGRLAIVQLMSLPAGTLGWVSLDNIPAGYIAVELLGSGATAQVYSGRKRGEKAATLVLKVCNDSAAAEKEEAFLKMLESEGLDRGVPKVLERGGCTLVLSPIARPFSRDELMPRAIHFTQILGVLKVSHKLGIVHCDVRPVNWMLTESHEAILIDWGFSRNEADEEKAYAGTVSFASESVLAVLAHELGAAVKVTASDDLVSFVRLAFYYATGLRPLYDDNASRAKMVQASRHFWEQQTEASKFWQAQVAAATALDYATLGELAQLFGQVRPQ
jgi:hypothetical protein